MGEWGLKFIVGKLTSRKKEKQKEQLRKDTDIKEIQTRWNDKKQIKIKEKKVRRDWLEIQSKSCISTNQVITGKDKSGTKAIRKMLV